MPIEIRGRNFFRTERLFVLAADAVADAAHVRDAWPICIPLFFCGVICLATTAFLALQSRRSCHEACGDEKDDDGEKEDEKVYEHGSSCAENGIWML